VGCVVLGSDCEDGNPCTIGNCIVGSGCEFTPTDAPCDDNDVCTTDACDNGVCVGTPSIDCDDGDACTVDTCDPVDGCSSTTLDCDDGDVCTTDGCDSATGCTHTTITCDDGDACTEDGCHPVNGCGATPITCDDGDICTDDSCDPGTGCTTSPIDCDDGNACSVDACDQGSGCTYEVVFCNDGDPCTTDSCNPATGCETLPTDCNDFDACTQDTCDSASGCLNTAITCADGEVCTDDSCDPQTGCVFTNNTAPCDDGEACTSGDQCSFGTCVGSNAACDDGDPCTIDTCDALGDCDYDQAPFGTPCDDGNVCTATDICFFGGDCAGLAPLNCNDDEPCTADSCDPVAGCVNSPTIGASCDGDDSDNCSTGICEDVGGVPTCVEQGSATGQVVYLTFDDNGGYTSTNQRGEGEASIHGGGWESNGVGGSALELGGAEWALFGSSDTCASLGWEKNGGDPSICGASEPCSGEMTFKDAVSHCASMGGRICTETELDGNAVRQTGCGYDDSRIWSSTPCDSDSVITQAGRTSFLSNHPKECTPRSQATGVNVRCCADDAPRLPALGPGSAYSFEAWVRQNSTSGTQTIASITNTIGDGTDGVKFRLTNGRPQLGYGGCQGISGPGAQSLSAGQWHHVVGTFDGTTGRVYANGVLLDSGSGGGLCESQVGAPLVIGARFDDASEVAQTFLGDIDQFSFYDRALSPEEVDAHYQAAEPAGRLEVCNGVNDDCQNGSDNGLDIPCDDGDPCTVDSCGGASGCTSVPLCTGNTYCDAGTCLDQQDAGGVCTGDEQCISGTCAGGFCLCDGSNPCPASQWCDSGTCAPKKDHTQECAAAVECLSGTCLTGSTRFCACDAAVDPCGAGTFCGVNGTITGYCEPQYAADSACAADFECLSGDCAGDGTCKCSGSVPCPSGKFCNNSNKCRPVKDVGENCSANDWCASGVCLGSGVCGCSANKQCGQGVFCDTDNTCQPQREPLEACTSSVQCLSQTCTSVGCGCGGQASTDCGSDRWCDTNAKACKNKRPTLASCTLDASCWSGACLEQLGFCGCADDGDCPEDRFCNVNNFCQKKKLQGSCTANRICASGQCLNPGQGAASDCTCLDDTYCGENQYCSNSTLVCEDMVEVTVPICNGTTTLGFPCSLSACWLQAFGCPALQYETYYVVPPNPTCVDVDGPDATVNCFGEVVLEEPVAMTTADGTDWEFDNNSSTWSTTEDVDILPTNGSNIAMVPSGNNNVTLPVPSAALTTVLSGVPFPGMPTIGGESLTSVLTEPVPTSLLSGSYIANAMFDPLGPVPFCNLFPALDPICAQYSYDYKPPLRGKRAYLAMSVTGDMTLVGPRAGVTLEGQSLEDAKVIIDPNDPMYFIHGAGKVLSDATNGVVQAASFAMSDNGLLEQTTKLQVPWKVQGGCSGNDAVCLGKSYLKSVSGEGHVHAFGGISIKAQGIPMTIYGEFTLDLDPDDNGMLSNLRTDNLFQDINVGGYAGGSGNDFTLVADGLVTVDFDANGKLPFKFKLPVAEASMWLDSRSTPSPAQAQTGFTNQGGLHFHGRTIEPTLPDFIDNDFGFDPPVGGGKVMGYFIDDSRWWFYLDSVSTGVTGLDSTSLEFEFEPSGAHFAGNMTTPLATLDVTGDVDFDTGNWGFCGDGAVGISGLDIGANPSATMCFSKTGSTKRFDLEANVDVDVNVSDFISGNVCGWIDYEPNETTCDNECDWDTFWNCVSEIPGVGDDLSALVNAACKFGSAAIDEVSGQLVKACKTVSQNMTFEVEFAGAVGISATMSAGAINQNSIDLSGGFSVTVKYTVPGTSRKTTVTLASPTLQDDGDLVINLPGVPGSFCVNVFDGSFGCN